MPLLPEDVQATPRWDLPLLFVGQAQKELFVNEALNLLDSLIFLACEGERAAPPSVAADAGQCWIVASGAQEEWQGRDTMVAIRTDGGWRYVEPEAGMGVYDRGSGCFRRFIDGGWAVPVLPPMPSGGEVIDVEARAVLAQLSEILRTQALVPRLP